MKSQSSSNFLRYALLLIFISVPLANFILSPILSDGSQFADDPETRVAAAGYAFAIWGVIFTGMLWFSGYLAFGNEPHSPHLRLAIICLMIAGLASIAFVPISIYCNSTIGWIDIMAHLIPLSLAAIFLRKHVASVTQADSIPQISSLTRSSFFAPSMYFGWISAATVISTSLMASEWCIELGEQTATNLAIITLVSLAVFAIWMTWKRDPIYGGTVCWALIAVGIKQEAFPSIQYGAWIAAAAVGLVVLFVLVRRRPFFYPNVISRSGIG